ncbi:MAG: hypothetical protein LBE71_02930 [Dysgonamonadaceae bacterium]|jgi:hypothetical protein|nr:hypothetical protein [Dysgonamonadaceae bacterium]
MKRLNVMKKMVFLLFALFALVFGVTVCTSDLEEVSQYFPAQSTEIRDSLNRSTEIPDSLNRSTELRGFSTQSTEVQYCSQIKTWGATGLWSTYVIYMKKEGEDDAFTWYDENMGYLWHYTTWNIDNSPHTLLPGDAFYIGVGAPGEITWSPVQFIYTPGVGWLCMDVWGGWFSHNYQIGKPYA